MFDASFYKWMDKGYSCPEDINEKEALEVFNFIDKKNWNNGKKNIVGRYYLDQLNKDNGKAKKLSTDLNKEIRSWEKSSSFKKLKDTILQEDVSKFMMSGMIIVMAGTIIMFFLGAYIRQSFVVNLAVDGVVAAIAVALLIRNVQMKYKLVERYGNKKDNIIMDICSIGICIGLKIIMPTMFDFSLFVLFASHLVQNYRFKKDIKEFD